MKILFKSGILAALINLSLNATVIDNAAILSEPVKAKLNSIGDELKSKTAVTLDLVTFKSLGNQNLNDIVKPYLKELRSPYIVLALVPKDIGEVSGKVAIYTSKDAQNLFDKEAVLSPFPEQGSIIPILSSDKGKDIYNASMINGYADIADRVASSKGIKLQNSIGSTNRVTLNILRYLIYGSILLVIVVLLIKKARRTI